MRERLKTVLLTVLVAASLIQSYLLAYNEPKFDTVIPADYVESELEGTQTELANLLFPKDIVLHYGNSEYTVLYPGMIFYSLIMDVVEQRTFEGLRAAGDTVDKAEWIANSTQGIEIRFAGELSLQLLQQLMNLPGDDFSDLEPIDRIHIYTQPEREEVRVYFAGSRNGVVYEAIRADLTVKDVERFIGFGETRVKYMSLGDGHYIPEKPLPMVEYRLDYRQFTPDQLQRSLFPDPFKTRNLTERDGSEIYTDGKRGLQLSMGQKWMRYTDPAAPAEGVLTPLDAALASVQFVNRHGGWNGDYMLEQVSEESAGNERQVTFQHYIGSYLGAYPIVGTTSGLPFGSIQLTLRNRTVTGYERSTVQVDNAPAQRTSVTLPGGDELLEIWEKYPDRQLVEQIYPAYRAILSEEEVLLTPIWALTMADGTVRALPGGGSE